jgi:hypothetical protein
MLGMAPVLGRSFLPEDEKAWRAISVKVSRVATGPMKAKSLEAAQRFWISRNSLGVSNGRHSRDTYICGFETSCLSTRKPSTLQLLWTNVHHVVVKLL